MKKDTNRKDMRMIRLNQIKLDIFENKELIKNKIAKKLRISKDEIIEYKIFKESIDARRKKIKFNYAVDVVLKNEKKILKKGHFKKSPDYTYKNVQERRDKNNPIIIVGAGPSGLFAALTLASQGYKPMVVEQGEPVEKRVKSIEKFWKEGILNEYSNVQFGEGGAGTFSDGKLTTRIKDPRCRRVLETFIKAGAPDEIIYKNKPHIGTDHLRRVIINIRKEIISLGGTFHFNSKVTDIVMKDDEINGVLLEDGEVMKASDIILALGHSSRDLFEKLYEHKVAIESKPFAIGVRIEHPQKMIDMNQYGNAMVRSKLGAAEYKLTYQSEDRGVYSFCMCPGGEVVAASSEKNTVVTNGMSHYKRNKDNANAAILVTVKPEDYGTQSPLDGMYFQRRLEEKAFIMGGENYYAPATRLNEYLELNIEDYKIKINPSYTPGVKYVDFNKLFPEFVNQSIKEALLYFDQKISGFARPDAILTGVETRSSSPVRIIRDKESYESINTKGLYPCGEGAGYAGGIMSSAVDGIKVAEKVISRKR